MTLNEISSIESHALAQMKDNGHSLLSPSGASTWMGCAGSQLGIHGYRLASKDNPASIEGTCGHFLLEHSVSARIRPTELTLADCTLDDDVYHWRDAITKNPVNDAKVKQCARTFARYVIDCTYTDEMRSFVATCYDAIMVYVRDGWLIIAEARVKLAKLLGHAQCDGTSDIVLYNPATGEVIIADLKYGKGIPVSPVENAQLKIYAMGALLLPQLRKLPRITKLSLVIMQPRIDNNYWVQWDTTVAKTLLWLDQDVKPASLRALHVIGSPDLVVESDFTPNIKSCTWCNRRGKCEAQKKSATSKIKDMFGAVIIGTDNNVLDVKVNTSISDDDLRACVDAMPFINKWLASIEKEITARVKRGVDTLGRKMVKGRKNRSWDEKDDAKMLQKMRDIVNDAEYELLPTANALAQLEQRKVSSPAQLEKSTIPSDIVAEIMTHCVTVLGNDVMVLDTDSRKSKREINLQLLKEAQDG